MTGIEQRQVSGTGRDVVAAVVAQHGRITAMMREVGDASDAAARREAFDVLRGYLAQHEAAEEEAVHPVAGTAVGGEAVAHQRELEETGAAQQIKRLEELDAGSPSFGVQFGLFEEAVDAHATAEEKQELPLLEGSMSPDAVAAALEVLATVGAPEHRGAGDFATMLATARQRFRAMMAAP